MSPATHRRDAVYRVVQPDAANDAPPINSAQRIEDMKESSTLGRGPVLIVIGGLAGTGKTAVSRRLSRDLSVPRLGSDTIGRVIKGSAGIKGGEVDAYWIAYEVLFRLCEEFIQSGVSVVLDLTLGWPFQWRSLDGIIQRHPTTVFLPVVLRCPHEQCMARIQSRHEAKPEYYDPPHVYTTEQKILNIWTFLQKLDRPEVRFVDATGSQNEVYDTVKQHIAGLINGCTTG